MIVKIYQLHFYEDGYSIVAFVKAAAGGNPVAAWKTHENYYAAIEEDSNDWVAFYTDYVFQLFHNSDDILGMKYLDTILTPTGPEFIYWQ